MKMHHIIPIEARHRDEVNEILAREWSCPPSISRGNTIDTTGLPGFICEEAGKIIGVITYQIKDHECEIVTLNSFRENAGIGTALLQHVKEVAVQSSCTRVWLITTNDDIGAIRFYQKRGMELVQVHINAMEKAREMKPSIPLIGMDRIPIKHEFEFEYEI